MSLQDRGREIGRSIGNAGKDLGQKSMQLGKQVGKTIGEFLPPNTPAIPLSTLDVPTAEAVKDSDKKHKSVKHWKRRAVRPAFWGTVVATGGDALITHQLDPRFLAVGGALYLLSATARGIANHRAEKAEDEALRLAQTNPDSVLSRELFASHSRRRLNKGVKVGGIVGTGLGIVTALHATVIAPVFIGLHAIIKHGQHEHRKHASRLAKTTLKDFA